MRSRLRNLDSKVTFFAFADIITAVSGMLIFITLLIATDLERPAESRSQSADQQSAGDLQDILRQQAEADSENRRLQELLAAAETAPAPEKLESDISQLRSQINEETQKQTAISSQVAGSRAEILARDRTLGLTDLKTSIESAVKEAESIASQEVQARSEMANLEQQVAQMQSRLLKARQREGQLWIIPEKGTDKEPIFVTVAGDGVTVDRFDHPEERRQLNKVGVVAGFETYLHERNPLNQYVVFLIRPSGISLFEDLARIARSKNFEVGFDALEENRQLHFSAPPPLDEPTAQTNASTDASPQTTSYSSGGTEASTNPTPAVTVSTPSQPQPAAAASPATSPPPKSWWRRFLEWIGLA